jgi:ABC-type lipoprotein export system ATPase subunit
VRTLALQAFRCGPAKGWFVVVSHGSGERCAGVDARKNQIAAILDELGVAHRSGHFPREMSGGEAVRVAVAMALVAEPKLILADEATGELDPATADSTMNAIVKRSIDHGVTLLYVTHDMRMAGYAENRLTLTGNVLTRS